MGSTLKRTAAAALVIGLGLSSCRGAPQAAGTAEDGLFIENAKKLAARGFKDPEGAQFQNAFVQRQPKATGAAWRSPVVCGMINARNSYGAYSGYRRFIAEPASGERRLEPMEAETNSLTPEAAPPRKDSSFDSDWRNACIGNAPPIPIKNP